MELLRRTILVAGLVCALWFAASPAPALVRVRAVDFAAEQARKPKFAEASRLPLAEFIVEETRDRLVAVEGAEWEELLRVARRLAAGRELDAAWLRRANLGGRATSFFFRPDEAPVRDLAGKLSDDHPFTYVAVGVSGYLGVTFSRLFTTMGAPRWLAYPLRRYAVWVFAAALLLYVLLPWPRVRANTAYYSRVRASVLPDLIGVMLTGVFFVMPLIIVPQISPRGDLLDAEGGWIILTLVFWALCVFGLAIFAVAARYTACQVRVLEDRLEYVTLTGVQAFPYGEIAAVELAAYEPPRALVRAGFIVSLINWRAAGPTLLVASRTDSVLRVKARDGRSFQLVLTALRGVKHVIAGLQNGGVALSDEVARLGRGEKSVEPEAIARRTWVATTLAVIAIAIGATAAGLWAESPQMPRVEAPDAGGPPVTIEQVAEQGRLIEAMSVERDAMKRALDRYKAASEDDAAQRKEALREFEAAKKRFENLHSQFEAVGKGASGKPEEKMTP
ncbi:MAG TPA: hypothetical protein PLE19_23015 [Planctomycetota bacterium]|nr:hypothetical protein [Planctomycetota bacterium]HRR82969.1 hypothetical protein [Planctomycetota bacterium]HRT96784.1 hypothetical protein [Planctomycetota bacterium]